MFKPVGQVVISRAYGHLFRHPRAGGVKRPSVDVVRYLLSFPDMENSPVLPSFKNKRGFVSLETLTGLSNTKPSNNAINLLADRVVTDEPQFVPQSVAALVLNTGSDFGHSFNNPPVLQPSSSVVYGAGLEQ